MSEEHNEFEPVELHGHPHRTGRFWFDFIAAGAAILIAMISLFVAIRGEGTQRKLLEANAWPFLQLSSDQHYHGDDVIGVENAGVGPAKVISFEVFLDGRPIDDPLDLLARCCGLSNDPGTMKRQIPNGVGVGQVSDGVLRPGETAEFIDVRSTPDASEIVNRFGVVQRSARLSFRSCYCSILDECWVGDLRSLRPKRVASCPSPTHPFGLGRDFP